MENRKNIKGFTLIELLAVIVILGVLIGIAFPSISRRIRETRDKTYNLHEADMKAAASNLMSECVSRGEECVPNGESRTYYLSELIDSNYSEKLKDPDNTNNFCDEEKSYVVVKNDSDNLSNFEYEVCLVCSNYASERCKEENNSDRCENIEDNEGPECGEVNGGSTIWTNSDRVISIGCKDKGGCGCSQDIYYKRFSETGERGTIEIKDRKGNKTSCEVNVYIDKQAPECELEVIGTVGENGWYGNKAPIVRFKSRTDKESGIESYGLGTSSKEYNFNREEEYTVGRGITTVYGYVRDNAGNVGMCHTDNIKYDDVKPTITNVRYGYQVYPKEDMATKGNNKITINDISGEYGTIYGIEVELNDNPNGMNLLMKQGNNQIGEVTISSGVTTMKYNITPGVYNNISFEVGNGQSIDRVKTIRLLTGAINGNYYTNKDVIIYITSHDSYSGKAYYTFDGVEYDSKDTKQYGQNNDNIKIGIKDHAGNKSPLQAVNLINIDKQIPSCELKKEGTEGINSWYRSDVTVSYQSKTDNLSGIRHFNLGTNASISEYNVQSTRSDAYDNIASKVQTSDTSGQNWYGHIIDKAGNVSRCDINVKRDTVKPTCTTTTTHSSWTNQNVTLTGTCTDDRSKCRGNISQTYTDEMDTSKTPGTVLDEAGNEVTCDSMSVKIDKTRPTCNGITKTETWVTTGVDGYSSCTDDASGCASSTFSFYDFTSDGSVQIKDNAGNTRDCGVSISSQRQVSYCSLGSWGTSSSVCGTEEKSIQCHKSVPDGTIVKNCDGYSASQCYCWYDHWDVDNEYGEEYENDTILYNCNCSKNVAKTCRSTSFGCDSWGGYSNVSSCTNSNYSRRCRTVYY